MSLKELFASEWFTFFILLIIGIKLMLPGILQLIVNATNSEKPTETAHVKILYKQKVTQLIDYVVVEFNSGERKRFDVAENIAVLLMQNDVGELTYQGSKVVKFERQVEKDKNNE